MQKNGNKGKKPAKSLKERAQAIIEGAGYDEDTRESIKFELETNDPGLEEMVRRAEKGETICDTLRVYRDFKRAAQRVITLFNDSPGVPDFLTNAMMVAIQQAADIKKIRVWKETANDGEDFDLKGLAELFGASGMLSLQPATPRAALARALFTILQSEETPVRLFDAVGDFITEGSSGDMRRFWTTPVLEHLFDFIELEKAAKEKEALDETD